MVALPAFTAQPGPALGIRTLVCAATVSCSRRTVCIRTTPPSRCLAPSYTIRTRPPSPFLGRSYTNRAERPGRDDIIPNFFPAKAHPVSPAMPGFRFDAGTLEEMRRHLERATRDQTVETLRDRPAPSPASAQFNQTSATVTPQAAPVVAQTEQATATVTPKRPTREAAICLLFCEVDEVPSVLYTVRSPRLRRHTGEISFPGGVRDPSDASPLAAALRETREEIGINEADVTVLGGLPWLPDLTGRMRVYPFCGFVDLAKLGIRRPSEIKGNPTEVARVFHLTVPQLLDPNRRRDLKFRNRDVAYTAFRADDVDLLPELPQSVIETGDLRALADYEHQYGSTVVWGLTGYVTTQVLRIAVEPVVEQLRVAREGSGKG